MLSIIVTICLEQNYTASLIIGSNDGIGITNSISYFIIGESNWSVETFKTYFMSAVYISICLVCLLIVSLIYEARNNK